MGRHSLKWKSLVVLALFSLIAPAQSTDLSRRPYRAEELQTIASPTVKYDKQQTITQILKSNKEFTQEMFNQLLTRPGFKGQGTLNALFYTDIQNLIQKLEAEFPQVVKVGTVGKSFQGRDIKYFQVDAREYLVDKRILQTDEAGNDKIWTGFAQAMTEEDAMSAEQQELKKHFHKKPAILITGQIHAREAITSSMVLFSMLKLIHGGIVHNNQQDFNMLIQNKYYVIPTINVDGWNFVQENFLKDGIYYDQRKNLNFDKQNQCKKGSAGVDLNRNWGYNFGQGDNSEDKCDQTFKGPEAFSEPETRAVRDFIAKHKDELKFVYNFHCAGNMFFIPFNGKFPNILATQFTDIYNIFKEIATDAQFPATEDIGPSEQNLKIIAGGDAGDYITHQFSIPAAEAELGEWTDYNKMWMPHSAERAFSVIKQNMPWLEHTYQKLGNQITFEAAGYSKARQRHDDKRFDQENNAILYIKVTNHGLSDQVHDDMKIKIGNLQLEVLNDHKKNKQASIFLAQHSNQNANLRVLQQGDNKDVNNFYINGLKARSSKTIAVPVKLQDPQGFSGFYNRFTGDLTTNIQFHQFQTSTEMKNQFLTFKMLSEKIEQK